jgi:hypothetical protein
VADPHSALDGALLEQVFELLQFPLAATHLDAPVTDHRDAGAVIASVLKAPESTKE